MYVVKLLVLLPSLLPLRKPAYHSNATLPVQTLHIERGLEEPGTDGKRESGYVYISSINHLVGGEKLLRFSLKVKGIGLAQLLNLVQV